MRNKCRESIVWFSEKMENKLKKNDRKGGWKHCDVDWLLLRLDEEINELKTSIYNEEDEDDIINECADVANFAMMIADLNNKK